jgi:multimeric flavodoxin WrbA
MLTRRSIDIVALNGSPHRHGNTATLMQWVVAGCETAGAHDVTWIHVIDYNLRFCEGCFTCLRTGVCPLEDDYLALRARLIAADGIIVGSPVYEGEPTAQLKVLLDRLTLLHLYTQTFEDQRTIGIATSGVAPTRGVAKSLANFFGRPVGILGAKTSTVAHGYRPLTDSHPDRLPEKARRMGERLAHHLSAPSRIQIPTPQALWIALLRHVIIRRMITGNPEQFNGVIEIWRQRGWLKKWQKEADES